jgi:hypothetical protein
MNHQIVHTLQKYFLNPTIKIALAMSLPLPGYALLETKGRKTGMPRRMQFVIGERRRPFVASPATHLALRRLPARAGPAIRLTVNNS